MEKPSIANKDKDVAVMASRKGAELQRRIARLSAIREKQEVRNQFQLM